MKSGLARLASMSAALVFLATTACDQTQAVAKPMPEGEDDFSCAALIYGAAHYVESDEHKADLEAIKSASLTAGTRYTAAFATSKGMDGMEAFNRVKIKGLLMSGTPSGNSDELPTAEHVERAKACAGVA
jgi:hypothetical protein